MASVPAIGINLGAAVSSVAVFENNVYTIIANEEGTSTTPSYVTFAEEQLIGEEAKNRLKMEGENVVFNVKQMIGRHFNDRFIKEKKDRWPFVVIEGYDEKPRIEVKYGNEMKTFTSEQIVSILLSKMKSLAENHCQQQIPNAVISVPSFFNSHQRQSTINAANNSGFRNVRLINDTTAIALSYFNRLLERREVNNKTLLIFDLGATSLEVSVVLITPGSIQVKSTAGTSDFGGNDFDERLMRHLFAKFICNPQMSPNLIQRLRCYCEEAKKKLSTLKGTKILINHFLTNVNIAESITRDQFEIICGDLFYVIAANIERAVLDANLEKDNIDEIIVVGGASKMPKIIEILRQMFGGKKVNTSLNAMGDCIAIGAAIQASIINKSNTAMINVKIKSIIPYCLGIETKDGIMSRVINRNTKIPCRLKKCFTTSIDNQRQLKVKIFIGDAVLTKFNHLIGVFTFDGISLASKGDPEIELYFEVDVNGVLTIYGSERLKSKQKEMAAYEHIESMAGEAVIYEKEEERRLSRSEAKNNLEAAMIKAERLLPTLSNTKRDDVRSWLHVVSQWLKYNEFASKDELDAKRLQIEHLIDQ